ncbi:MAG: phosphoenolpyruvate--protein phosphotransferase [Calditrichaeota bacterium]|nr:MAG: phosphoenolpyruvate--protein phosphotransferase [Calditrichota bacterium]
MKSKSQGKNKEYSIQGIPVSPGIAIGRAFVLEGVHVKIAKKNIAAAEVDIEIEKFHEAIKNVKKQLSSDISSTKRRIGEANAQIFDTHLLILDDPMLTQETIEAIRQDLRSAAFAFYSILEKFQSQLALTDQEYFRERAVDLRDIRRRVVRCIQGDKTDFLKSLEGAAIVIAHDLAPSDTITLDRHKILGFATDVGGKTSHSAILARSFRVPASVGLRYVTKYVKSGDRLILDGSAGKVLINPSETTLKKYYKKREQIDEINIKLTKIKDLPARTLDGKDIELAANIEFTDEAENGIKYGARGIGLFRSDYLYLARNDLPTEEEQFIEYRKVVEKIYPYPVIIRTLDVGGDKEPQNIHIESEANPFLGYRAIRISLQEPDIFIPQLKAILRASVYGNVKLLFPMISSMTELYEAKAMLEKAKSELIKKNKSIQYNLEVGAMIEVPAAALITDKISEEVDFLSIGTNDLIQYMLAVDRGNERVAYLYKDLHPAVLRMIKEIILAAHQKGTWVGMCGEMAGNPLATLILIGLSIDELSVSPMLLPEIKKIIRATDFKEAAKLAEKALTFSTAVEVETFMLRYMRRKFKDLIF